MYLVWNKMNCELMLTYDTPAYKFNVYKNQLSRQTGSRILTGPKTLPTIWHTYMKLVTKYQISAINSCWEKCDEKYLGRTEGQTEVKQYTPLRWSWGIITSVIAFYYESYHENFTWTVWICFIYYTLDMTSFIGYLNNAMIKFLIYFTSHMNLRTYISYIECALFQ